jgi:hypothetical protein
MNEDREREEIAGWFRHLRQTEERDAPPFDEVWEAARSRATESRSRRLYYRVAAAAALLALLAVPALWRQRRRQAPEVTAAQIASISQWKSPTAFLIETPGQELLKTVPRIGDGFMDMRTLNREETSEEKRR